MSQTFRPPRRNWPGKFRDAFAGIFAGVRGQNSFPVHAAVSAAVILAGAVLQVNWMQWALLVLCIALVLAAELFNTALESLARVSSDRYDARVERALKIAAGAVLMVCIGAGIVGTLVLLPALLQRI